MVRSENHSRARSSHRTGRGLFSSEYLLLCGVQQDFRFLVVAPPRSIIPAVFFSQFMYPGPNPASGSVSSQFSTFDIFVLGAIA